MGDQPPAWMEAFMLKQSETLSNVLERHLSSIGGRDVPLSPPRKKTKSRKGSMPPTSPKSHPRDSDDDDEFDRRYGHLIGLNVEDEDCDEERYEEYEGFEEHEENDNHDVGRKEKDMEQDDIDDTASVDEDLLVILDKVPNWDTGSSITKFIKDCSDRSLPDDMLKKLNEDFVPSERIQAFFSPPSMPTRLYRAVARMKSKGAFKTGKALYNAQTELFIIAKPLLAALIELKPLGAKVKSARELLSISLQGIFSVSLKLSKARKENVRFLFKENLAEVLYSYSPRYCSLYGGDSFNSQVEKAAKEAKIDISWSKSRPAIPYQPFRNAGYQGFQYTGNAGQYFRRQKGRRGGYGPRGRGNYGNNTNNYGNNYGNNNNNNKKNQRGYGRGKKQ